MASHRTSYSMLIYLRNNLTKFHF